MAKLPAAQQHIGKGIDSSPHGPDVADAAYNLPADCCNPTCDAPAFDRHHIVRRSHLGGPFDYVELFGRVWLNLAQVCRSCHDDLEQNRVTITAYPDGYYRWAGWRLDPYPHPVLEDGESAGVFPPFHATLGSAGSPSSSTGVTEGDGGDSALTEPSQHQPLQEVAPLSPSPSVTPGSTCPECNRRVPHPRKPSSPSTKVYGMRIPLDEAETFGEVVDAAAEHLGVKSQPHHRFKTLSLAAALVLQDEGLRGFGRR